MMAVVWRCTKKAKNTPQLGEADSAKMGADEGRRPCGEVVIKVESPLRQLAPVLWALRLTGLFTYIFRDRDGQKQQERHLVLLVWAVVLRVIHVAFPIVLLIHKFNEGVMDLKTVGDLATVFTLLLIRVSLIYMMIILCYRSSLLAKMMVSLNDLHIDLFVENVYSTAKYTKWSHYKILKDPILISLAINFILGIIYQIVHFIRVLYKDQALKMVMFMLITTETIIVFLVIALYRAVINCLAWNLQHTAGDMITERGSLKDSQQPCLNIKILEEESFVDKDKSISQDYLQYLGNIYFKVNIVRGALLAYMGGPLCLAMASYTTTFISFVYKTVFTEDFSSHPLVSCIGIICYLLFAVAVCRSPEFLKLQVAEVDLALHRLQHKASSERLTRKLGVVREVLQRIPDFCIQGYFSLGNHIIVSLSGFVMTYLILLLQVGRTTNPHLAHLPYNTTTNNNLSTTFFYL